MLSDIGVNFSARLRGFEAAFEINLRQAGVRAITSKPYQAFNALLEQRRAAGDLKGLDLNP